MAGAGKTAPADDSEQYAPCHVIESLWYDGVEKERGLERRMRRNDG
jgi:hypothetical protein